MWNVTSFKDLVSTTFTQLNPGLNPPFLNVSSRRINKLYQKVLSNLALWRLSLSHQSLRHFVLAADQPKDCSFPSAKDFNGFQFSMRQGNKSANPAFIQASRFVSLLLDLRHPDWCFQRKKQLAAAPKEPIVCSQNCTGCLQSPLNETPS